MKFNTKQILILLLTTWFIATLILGHDHTEVEASNIILNGATTREVRGSNYWPTTNLREWLNSVDATVKYTNNPPSAAHLGENAYDKEAGFLRDFTTAERNAIVVTSHRVTVSQSDATQLNAPGGVRPYGNGAIRSPYLNYAFPGLVRDHLDYNHVVVNDKVFLAGTYDLFLYLQKRGYSLEKEPTEALKSKGFSTVNRYFHSGGESYNSNETTYSTQSDGLVAMNSSQHPRSPLGIVPMIHVNGSYRFSNGTLARDMPMGGLVTFGSHLGESIQWRVVNRTNGHALLISEKIIDVKPMDAPGDKAFAISNHVNFTNPQANTTNYPFFASKNNDGIIPDLTIVNDAELNKRQNSGFSLQFRASDAHGIDHIVLPNGSIVKTETFSYAFPKNGTYDFVVVDKSGNHRYYVLPIGNVNVPYRMEAIPSTTEWTDENITVEVRATNEGVGSSLADVTTSKRDTYMTEWPDYSTFMEKRIRVKGNIEYIGSTQASVTNRRVIAGFRYNYTEFDGEEWNKRGRWHQAISWNLDDVRKAKKIPFDVVTVVPSDFFEELKPWLSVNMPFDMEGAYTVRWTDVSFELLDDNDYEIKQIILPNGTTINRANYLDTLTSSGTYTYTAVDARGLRVSDTVFARIDKVKPTITQRSTHTTWTNAEQQLVQVRAADAGSGLERVRLPNNTHVTNSTALNQDISFPVTTNGTYSFTAFDKMGHSQVLAVSVTNFDRVAPNGSVSGNPSAWQNTNATLTFNATDSGGSGVRRVRIAGGTWVNGSTVSQVATENGTYSFDVEDHAGNVTTVPVTVNRIDKTAPNGTISGNPTTWQNTNATLSLNATDSGGAGVRRVRVSGGTWVNGSSISQTATENGTYSFEIEDHAGNSRTVSTTVNRIDKTEPTGSITGNPTAWQNTDATLTFNATDSGGAGVRRVRIANGTWVAGSTTTHIVSGNGTYAFEVEDNAGNTKTVNAVVNRIDKTLPNGTIAGNPTSWQNTNATLTLSATDSGGAGIRRVRIAEGTWVTGTTTTQIATGNGTYRFEVEDHAGNTRIVEVTVNRIDKNAPNGTINGNPTSWTNANVTLSLSATDTGGSGYHRTLLPNGTYSTSVTPAFTVTENGSYTFTVFDHAGNSRDVTTTVNRIDKTQPTGNISGNPTVWTNQNVTLTLTTSDTGGSGYYRTLLPNGTYSTSTTPTYTVTGNGTYTFTVFDHAGNSRDVSATVNRIDKLLPTGTISGNPTAWTNSNVTLSLTASDTGGSGYYRTKLPNGSYSTSATPVVTVTENGTYAFEIFDHAGNSRVVSVIVNRIDKTLPNGTISGNPTTWQNSNVTLTLNATDSGGAGVKRVRISGGVWVNGETTTQVATENGTYAFEVEDHAGNMRTVSIVVNRIDKVDPTGTISGNPTAWQNTNVTLTFNATDSGGAGVKRVRISGGTWVNGATTTQVVSENGTYSFEVEDHAGNTRIVAVAVNRIDKSVPNGSITGNPTAWQNTDAVLTFSATDTGGSGVRRVRVLGGTWVTGASTTHIAGANGTYSFEVEDNAGNTRVVSVVVSRIDKTDPNGTISGNPTSWQNTNATLTFNATDAGGSGVRRVRIAGGTWVDGSTTTQVVTVNGTYSFEVEDHAGNTRTVSVTVNRIDKTLPTGNLSGNPTSWTNTDVTLVLSASDTGGSGYYRTLLPNGSYSTSPTPSFTASENGTYSFTIYDHAGNSRVVSTTVNRIDKILPGGTITGNALNWTNADVTLIFTATDSGGSGVKRVRQSGGTWVNGLSTSRTVSSNGTYSFEVEDHAGNVKTESISINRIDKTAPTLSITGNPTNWVGTDVTLSIVASDTGGSGVKEIILPNGNRVTQTTVTYTVPQNTTLIFRVIDHAGNETSYTTVVNRIDKVNPTASITPSTTTWTNQNVTLTINAQDANSGVREIVRPDGSKMTSASTTFSAPQNGTYTFRVVDNVGNTTIRAYTVTNIDKEPPSETIVEIEK